MSVHADLIAASEVAEESLDMLFAAEQAAKEGDQDGARAYLKAVAMLATSALAETLQAASDDLAGVAESKISRQGVRGPQYFASAHDAVAWTWDVVASFYCDDLIVRDDLLDWLSVNPSALRAYVRRERARLMGTDISKTPNADIPQSESTLPTIWYHGGQSYSQDGVNPINVPPEQHNLLNAFLDRDQSHDTKELSAKGVSNVAAVVKKLIDRFGADAIRTPGSNKGTGYFIRVRTKSN